MTPPTLGPIRKQNGVAGEYGYTVAVTYPDEETSTVTFLGSVYGPPIVMVTPGLPKGVFVSDRVLDRLGRKLTPEWVRGFFEPQP